MFEELQPGSHDTFMRAVIERGNDGWELVTVCHALIANHKEALWRYTAYFKRKKVVGCHESQQS